MDKTIKWFAGGLGAAFGTAFALMVGAAAGDMTVEITQKDKIITKAQFESLAQLTIDYGAWGGTADKVVRFCAGYVEDHYEIGNLHGLKLESPAKACARMPKCKGVVEIIE
jgi:hypothetical protein